MASDGVADFLMDDRNFLDLARAMVANEERRIGNLEWERRNFEAVDARWLSRKAGRETGGSFYTDVLQVYDQSLTSSEKIDVDI